ncbi:hypothetical protein ABZ490_09440, partial [Streptomyces sp. NPDC005811]
LAPSKNDVLRTGTPPHFPGPGVRPKGLGMTGYYDDFTMNVHILFDDTLVLEDPAATLGTILKSGEEVDVMAVLAAALDDLLDTEGSEKPDVEYMASPMWGAVVRAAGTAYALLTR